MSSPRGSIPSPSYQIIFIISEMAEISTPKLGIIFNMCNALIPKFPGVIGLSLSPHTSLPTWEIISGKHTSICFNFNRKFLISCCKLFPKTAAKYVATSRNCTRIPSLAPCCADHKSLPTWSIISDKHTCICFNFNYKFLISCCKLFSQDLGQVYRH